ncbi:MAG TPA: DUF2510 domain-containing protein [Cellulomonas sp.]
MSDPRPLPPAGWYPDGVTPGVERWFNGSEWTEQVMPLAPPAPPPPAPTAPTAPTAPVTPGWPAAVGASAPGHLPAGSPVAVAWDVPRSAPERIGAHPSDPVHWLLPTGRSWQSIVAGYLGLLALVVWPLAPFAIGLGCWALQRGRHGGHGRGRAVFAIVAGAIGCGLALWVLVIGPRLG